MSIWEMLRRGLMEEEIGRTCEYKKSANISAYI
jgi:hypothetical protein